MNKPPGRTWLHEAFSSRNGRPGGFFLILALACIAASCNSSPQQKENRFLARGDAAAKLGDFPRASLEYLNAVRVAPKDAEAWYRLGRTYLSEGSPRQAIAALSKAAEIDPKHVRAQSDIATLMAANRDLRAVAEAKKRLEGLGPVAADNPDVLDVLALTRYRLGEHDQAERDLTAEHEKLPAHLGTSLNLARMKLARNDVEGAGLILEEAAKADPKSPEAAWLLGRFYLLSGHPDRAEAELNRAVSLDPSFGPALLALAQRQFAAGRADQAEATYLRLSRLPDPNWKPLHAAFLFDTGRRSEAIAEFERLAQESPDDRDARTRLVAAYSATGRNADGDRVLASALKRNPADADALLQRGRMRVAAGAYKDAENDLRQVLHYKPDSAQAHYYLSKVDQGNAGASGRKQDLRRQELNEALRLDPQMLDARTDLAHLLIATNNPSAAVQLMNETPAAQRKSVAALAASNWAAIAAGDEATARKGVNAGLASVRDPELLLQDGALKLAAHDLKGALPAIEEAVSLTPESPQAWDFLLAAQTALGQPGKAMARLAAEAPEHPRSARLQLLLGRWLMEGKAAKPDPQAARAAFEAAKKADPNSVEADLAIARIDRERGDLDAAAARLRSILASHPGSLPALLALAEIAKKKNDAPAATDLYRKALEADPDNLLALNDLAVLLSAQKPDEALRFARRAGELAPDNPAVQDTVGWVYYRNGIYTSAVNYLRQAVERGPTPRRQYHLGLAYIKAGDLERGNKLTSAAIVADPTLAAADN